MKKMFIVVMVIVAMFGIGVGGYMIYDYNQYHNDEAIVRGPLSMDEFDENVEKIRQDLLTEDGVDWVSYPNVRIGEYLKFYICYTDGSDFALVYDYYTSEIIGYTLYEGYDDTTIYHLDEALWARGVKRSSFFRIKNSLLYERS